ncbi:MAG: hypothetical protein GX556_16015 [Fibrobacter sp.]|nr:hypothetical protein [Fibrobacter sp.]
MNMDLQNTPECFKGWQVTAFLMMWGLDLARRMFERSAEIGGVLMAGKKENAGPFDLGGQNVICFSIDTGNLQGTEPIDIDQISISITRQQPGAESLELGDFFINAFEGNLPGHGTGVFSGIDNLPDALRVVESVCLNDRNLQGENPFLELK